MLLKLLKLLIANAARATRATRIVGLTSIVFGVYLCVPWAAMAQDAGQPAVLGRMPTVTAESLSEKPFTLPAQLPAERSLVLVAFEREQQTALNTWVAGLNLNDGKLPWIETPVIAKPNALVRAFINGGMRSGIQDTAMRDRTITLYTDPVALRKDMGLSGDGKVVWVLVVDRAGQVHAKAEGVYSADKAKPLLEALRPSAPADVQK
jgi:hypothetical protein